MCPDYDPSKPSTWIMFLDANNLYAWAMTQYLPMGNFEWCHHDIDILSTPANSPIGYIFEVDLEYPQKLHDSHSDYPLAPETLEVSQEWLSPYQQKIVGGDKFIQCTKLVPNLKSKNKYVLHYRNLQQLVKLGLKVTKVHRVLQFTQAPWMKPYIDLNTDLRTKATSQFDKNFYKQMNCSVFGKTMENVRKRIRVDLCYDGTDKLRRLIADPAFITHKLFDNDLAAIHSTKSKLKLNKPIYTGMTILDLSKLFMYDFYYNKIKKRYADKAQLLYTDTDSLLLLVETPNIYDDMLEDAQYYDTSDYPEDHKLYSKTNKKVVGKFKDECNGKPISEFVGLRPKMYSIKVVDDGEIKKAKGVSKPVVEKELNHAMYVECVKNGNQMKHTMISIKSDHHHMGMYKTNKISLSALDTKKYICADGVTTLAYGHHRISEEKSPAPLEDILKGKTVPQLKQIARGFAIRGYYKMKKCYLIDVISKCIHVGHQPAT
jgi:hypothetical protein